MQTKDVLIITMLVIGLVGGYIVGSFTLQNQVLDLKLQIIELQDDIAKKDAEIENLSQTIEEIQNGDSFTKYEELKISSAIIHNNENATIIVKNTGSAEATLDQMLVNGKLNASAGWVANAYQLTPGQTATINVNAAGYDVGIFQSGVVYDFTIHTAGGGSYPASARAP